MKHERIYLDPTDDRVYIDTYVTNTNFKKKDAMLVIPGGGYINVSHSIEGEHIALAYLREGFNCFVLNYRVGKTDHFPKQLIDASRAVMYIKDHAEEFSINPDRVFAVGFSAGGHLAGSLATMHDDPAVREALGISADENKPRACVLSYPVISAVVEQIHKGSFVNLLGKPFDDITDEEKNKFSLELRVSEKSSPVFLWHTAEDTTVPPEGSLRLIDAYIKKKIPVQAAIYPHGPHALALSVEMTDYDGNHLEPIASGWVKDSVCFLKTL